MKKITKSLSVFVAAGLIMLFSVTAKAQSFDVGTSAINVGIGLGYSYSYYAAGGSATPVISGSYEYGVTKLGPGTLGLGVQIAYQGASYSYTSAPYYDYNFATGTGGGYYTYTVENKWTSTLFGIRGVYHPDFLNGDKYDVYGALQLSYNHVGYSNTYSTNDPYDNYNFRGTYSYGVGGGYFYPYIIIGGRYYFTDKIGVWAELGYSLAYFNIGLSIKFGGNGSGGGTNKK